MNFVFISPYFPSNFYKLCIGLKEAGAKVLGIGDLEYEGLRDELKEALTEYYRVDDLENYSQLIRACGYFTHKYGKIDRIEANNEYWLETDARLRTDFNVEGLKLADIEDMKYKSKMKEVFRNAGINVARGKVVESIEQAKDFIQEVGYPVVVKPDKGVGAADTYKLNNEEDLYHFFENKVDVDYIMEEYIQGEIHTFDGLVDKEGNVVFSSSMVYKDGIMETVNEGLDMFYYIPRQLPEDIVEVGMKTVNAFDLKERFFHFEYFKMDDGRIIALEVNVRPPGGLTLDMFNYANDINIYRQYGNVVVNNNFDDDVSRKYNCFFVGRKNFIDYKNSIEDILNSYGEYISFHEPIAPILAPALGDYGFVLRTKDLEKGKEIVQYAIEKV
ncbi:ATP-grasp domain-containing protein [Halanaerobium sp. Z-7514]|uniref:ATP-grasp domain-containing protein n=1 Tax=Halanaerobium polyolivorans TaxID=2886943 RepID=A0AAW4X1N3_9FIRM|nr:ATP-grasp domain-containing protein [Halanaerobium polyolivorans]MCC3145726.1 ATP-grasp domain-containing protein [Halanaerobium polyolivorans]